MKMIRVRKCNNCPYCEWQWADFDKKEMIFSCVYDEDNIKAIEDRFKIPKWCPLEDYEFQPAYLKEGD